MIAAFEGWNDAGEAATSALRYLAAAIRSVPVAEIDGEDFLDFTVRRPMVRFDADGARVIDWPGTRFRFGSADPSRELVVAHGVEPHVQWRRYRDLFAAVVEKLRVRRVVLLGAYVADVVYSRPVLVTGFATEPHLLESLEVMPSRYEGPTGIVGVLGDACREAQMPSASIWANVPHYISVSPNPKTMAALVHRMNTLLDLDLDLYELDRASDRFERQVDEAVCDGVV